MIDGKAKHSPTNDWDTNAVWVDARRAMTVTQERHTEPQDKTLSSKEIQLEKQRILKIQASLTAHWHDKGADWRGLAHTQAHHRSRLSDSVKNGNALRTMHNAALPAR